MDLEQTHPFSNLTARNVPHIPEKIFLYLDIGSFKTCLRVSKVWNNFLMNESFQRKAASVFHKDLLREEATLLAGKIRAFHRDQWIREVTEVFLAHLAMFMTFFFLIEWVEYYTREMKDQRPTLKGFVALAPFALLLVYLIIFFIFWVDANLRFTTETYKRKARSVPREGIMKNDKLLEISKNILKEEEKFCLEFVGFFRGIAYYLLAGSSAMIAMHIIIWCCSHQS